MIKTIQEQIEVMQHYANGGNIEIFTNEKWVDAVSPGWNWNHCDYRIKEQKKTITIEKWLIEVNGEYRVVETSNIESYTDKNIKVVKLLDSYEIQIEL